VSLFTVKPMQAFREVLRYGSVTLAANQMRLSQPATSRLIAQLEQEVGFELFYRDRGRLVPTPDGLLLFEEIERALDSLNRASDLALDIAEFRVGQLRIAAPPSFLESILPNVAARFLATYPRVRLTLDSQGVETTKALIASRAVDAGIVKLPLNRPDLRHEIILVSQTACVMHGKNPLADRKLIDPAALKDEPLILLGLGTSSRAQVEAVFTKAGIKPSVRVETHTIASACALAARGMGVAIVSELLSANYVGRDMVSRRFSPTILHEYAFVTAAATPPSRLALAFLDCCKAEMEAVPVWTSN
jgi:DNA-binding transcriptional LysR family regulator